MTLLLKDEIVETWFDTGGGRQNGPRLIYGQVIASGPKTATIRWESGLLNRVPQHTHLVKHARDHNLAVECLAKAGF